MVTGSRELGDGAYGREGRPCTCRADFGGRRSGGVRSGCLAALVRGCAVMTSASARVLGCDNMGCDRCEAAAVNSVDPRHDVPMTWKRGAVQLKRSGTSASCVGKTCMGLDASISPAEGAWRAGTREVPRAGSKRLGRGKSSKSGTAKADGTHPASRTSNRGHGCATRWRRLRPSMCLTRLGRSAA